MPEWSKGVGSCSTSASCVGSKPTPVMLLLHRARRDLPALRAQTTPGRGLEPHRRHSRWRRLGVSSPSDACWWSFFPLASAMAAAWPCDVRNWLKAPVRKGVGSTPTAVTRLALRRAHGAKPSQRPRRDSNLQSPDPQADASSIGPRGRCSRSTFRCGLWAGSLLHPGLGGVRPP